MKPSLKNYTFKVICCSYCLVAFSASAYCFFNTQYSEEEGNLFELSVDSPEPLITLSGKLISKLFPGSPEYSSVEDGDRADHCWVLQLDNASFDLALTTPVAEPARSLTDIMNWSNPEEVFLSLDEDLEGFCHEYADQRVIIEGHLFHAHTAHHYTPILLDVKKLEVHSGLGANVRDRHYL